MQSTQLSYLALGDSYTIGEMVASSERWPNQLVKMLETSNVHFHTPIPIAHSGFTTGELLQSLQQLEIQGKFDLVSLLIGVNNQYRNQSLSIYKKEFPALLQYALDKAKDKQHVFVVSIPDWGVTPFGEKDPRGTVQIGKEIEEYNLIAKEICAAEDVQFIDITPISKNTATAYWAVDLLHPSGLQYQQWAEKIFDCLQSNWIRSEEL